MILYESEIQQGHLPVDAIFIMASLLFCVALSLILGVVSEGDDVTLEQVSIEQVETID